MKSKNIEDIFDKYSIKELQICGGKPEGKDYEICPECKMKAMVENYCNCCGYEKIKTKDKNGTN